MTPFCALNGWAPEKAKPFVRRGRKATDLRIEDGRAAEGEPIGERPFLSIFQPYTGRNERRGRNGTS